MNRNTCSMDFLHPLHFDITAFVFIKRTWQSLKQSEACSAITKGQSQLPIEWISMRRHEETTSPSSIANGEEGKLSAEFPIIPFDVCLPFGFIHDRLNRRNKIPHNPFDPMDFFMFDGYIGFQSRCRIVHEV